MKKRKRSKCKFCKSPLPARIPGRRGRVKYCSDGCRIRAAVLSRRKMSDAMLALRDAERQERRNRIESYFYQEGWSGTAIAEEMGISHQRVYQILAGKNH